MPPYQGRLSGGWVWIGEKKQWLYSQVKTIMVVAYFLFSFNFICFPAMVCGLPGVWSTLLGVGKSKVFPYNMNASFCLVLCYLDGTKAAAGNDAGTVASIPVAAAAWAHNHKRRQGRQRDRVLLVKKEIILPCSITLILECRILTLCGQGGSACFEQTPYFEQKLEEWEEGDSFVFVFFHGTPVLFEIVSDKLTKNWQYFLGNV